MPGRMALLALIAGGLGVWGVARLPTAFIPIEDQGYLVLGLQLPDGASLERTDAGAGQGRGDRARHARRGPGDRDRRHIAAGQQRVAGFRRRRSMSC